MTQFNTPKPNTYKLFHAFQDDIQSFIKIKRRRANKAKKYIYIFGDVRTNNQWRIWGFVFVGAIFISNHQFNAVLSIW